MKLGIFIKSISLVTKSGLMKVLDLPGQPANVETNSVKLYLYSDGIVKKTYTIL